jgi:hypothetical protein
MALALACENSLRATIELEIRLLAPILSPLYQATPDQLVGRIERIVFAPEPHPDDTEPPPEATEPAPAPPAAAPEPTPPPPPPSQPAAERARVVRLSSPVVFGFSSTTRR